MKLLRNKWVIGISVLLVTFLLYGLLQYWHYYRPIPVVSVLPEKDNLIVFTGVRRSLPLSVVEGLFIIDVDTLTTWHWTWADEVKTSGFIAWSSQRQFLSIDGYTEQPLEASIYVLSPGGTVTKSQLVPPGTYGEHAWSPEGTQLVFSYTAGTSGQNSDLYIQYMNGSGLRRLTNMPSIEAWPNWSPSGKEIIFESYDLRKRTFAIYKIDQDATNLTLLADQFGNYNRKPQWSPSGTEIAFLRADDLNDPFGLWVMNSDGNDLKPIFVPPAGDSQATGVSSFAWSPDGKRLVFSSGHEGPCSENQTLAAEWITCDERIYIVNADGSGLTTLTAYPQPRYFDFAWIR